MGVVVIREEHPLAEFLKGIQPIGEASERHRQLRRF